jgi:hypothetical protein
MRTVEINLEPGELCEQMAAMRIWLDNRRWEPSTFSCRSDGLGVLLRIDFKIEEEGEAFARQFGGRMNDPALAA